MKKIISLLLTASLIFLYACGNSNDDTDNDSTTSLTETTTAHAKSFTEWNTELLPDNFPPPPEGAHSLSVETGSAATEGTGYRSDWVRLTFTCLEKNFLAFTAELFKSGYIGKAKYLFDTSYFPEGYNGSWHDGKTFVKINNAESNDSGEIVFQLDVTDCVDNFPAPIEEYFPKFEGYSRNEGYYYGYDGEDDFVTDKFVSFDQSEHWYWDFRYKNAFAGVTLKQFEAYVNELVDASFSGNVNNTNADSCTLTTADLLKKSDSGEVYGCFMIFNRSLMTLDIVYTNHAKRFVDYYEVTE